MGGLPGIVNNAGSLSGEKECGTVPNNGMMQLLGKFPIVSLLNMVKKNVELGEELFSVPSGSRDAAGISWQWS